MNSELQPDALRVIVVDDEAVVRMSLAEYLEDSGFKVESAGSAEETFRILREKEVDVMIVDLRLPGIDGGSLIERAAEMQADMRFLIYTGSADFRLPQPLVRLGIDESDVFTKPVMDLGIVKDAILRHVEKD